MRILKYLSTSLIVTICILIFWGTFSIIYLEQDIIKEVELMENVNAMMQKEGVKLELFEGYEVDQVSNMHLKHDIIEHRFSSFILFGLVILEIIVLQLINRKTRNSDSTSISTGLKKTAYIITIVVLSIISISAIIGLNLQQQEFDRNRVMYEKWLEECQEK